MYYKVCREENGKFYSVVRSNFKLEYGIGKETKPKVGFIFAFDKIENAKEYRDSLKEYINSSFEKSFKKQVHIFECEGELADEQPPFIIERGTAEDITKFWEEKWWKYYLFYDVGDKIKGTVFLKSIKLIKEMKK